MFFRCCQRLGGWPLWALHSVLTFTKFWVVQIGWLVPCTPKLCSSWAQHMQISMHVQAMKLYNELAYASCKRRQGPVSSPHKFTTMLKIKYHELTWYQLAGAHTVVLAWPTLVNEGRSSTPLGQNLQRRHAPQSMLLRGPTLTLFWYISPKASRSRPSAARRSRKAASTVSPILDPRAML